MVESRRESPWWQLPRRVVVTLMCFVAAGSVLLDGRAEPKSRLDEGCATMKPHLLMDRDKLETLRQKIKSIILGQNRDEILRVVGRENREELVSPKQARDWKERHIVFDVKIIGDRPGNVCDQQVRLIFDREDKLIRILSNVEGVIDR